MWEGRRFKVIHYWPEHPIILLTFWSLVRIPHSTELTQPHIYMHIFDEQWTKWISLQLMNVNMSHYGDTEWHWSTRSRDSKQKFNFQIVIRNMMYYSVLGSQHGELLYVHLDFLAPSLSWPVLSYGNMVRCAGPDTTDLIMSIK